MSTAGERSVERHSEQGHNVGRAPCESMKLVVHCMVLSFRLNILVSGCNECFRF